VDGEDEDPAGAEGAGNKGNAGAVGTAGMLVEQVLQVDMVGVGYDFLRTIT
jgi:hypothetical protein